MPYLKYSSRFFRRGEPLYPDDVLTDQTERFLAAERIREKVFLLTNQEVPYSVAVEIQGLKKQETD